MKDRSAVAILPPFVAEIGSVCSRSVKSLRNHLSTLPVRTKGLLVIGVTLAFVVHIGAVWLWSVNREHTRDRVALEHAQALHKGLQALLVQSLDANASMNAFLVTGQMEHLRAYRALEESAPQLLDQLASLVADRPEEKKWVHSAATDIEQLLDALSNFQYAASPDISEPGSLQELMATAERAAIKLRFDVAEIEKAEQRGLGRVIQEDGQIGWLGVGIATEIVFALSCGLAGIWFFANALHREQRRAPQTSPGLAVPINPLRVLAYDEVLKAEVDAMRKEPNETRHIGGSETPLFPAIPSLISPRDIPIARHAITDGKHSDRIRLRDMRVLQSVLDSLSDGVVVMDSQANCLFSNPAAEAMLGNNLGATPLHDWVTQFGLRCDDGSTAYLTKDLPLVQALLGTAVQRANIYVQRTESSQGLHVSVSAAPLKNETKGICGAVCVFSDVTERRNTEDALNHAKEDAERANRAKSGFLSRMSHELRTPLNAILGFAQLLRGTRLTDADRDSVEQILKAGRHLLELINEVLDVAKIESGRLTLSFERVATLETVQEAVNLIEPEAAKQKIQLYIEAGAAWRLHITADRQRFKQVVLNLFANAVKYNNEGGSVRISVEARNAHLKLSVADTGPGIAKEKLNLLFSPFERLGAENRGVEGTGIGLALSKGLVEAMSGRIGVESEAGQGTTFWVEFPIADANASDDPDLASIDLERFSRSFASDRAPVVLCIEDNDSNLRLIERTLEYRPEIKLISGKLGASALALAEAHLPDLILLDMHLPDLEGDQVLDILRSNPSTADIPIVVVSADATPRQMERMLSAGASAYLTKPLDIQKLLQVVDRAIGPRNNVPCLKT